MVNIDRDVCRRIFCRKGFTTEEGRTHTILFFKTTGGRTSFKTHMSRGSHGRKLDDYLIEQMTSQLKLSKEEFVGFYDCSLKEQDYIRLVGEKLGPDPLDLL